MKKILLAGDDRPLPTFSGCGKVGIPPDLESGDRQFEPDHPDQ